MEDHRCNGVEEEARLCNGGALSQGHHDNAGERGYFHGNVVVLGYGCHGNAGVQAEGRGQGWLEELSSGHSRTFCESQFDPHGASSAQTHCRLDRIK